MTALPAVWEALFRAPPAEPQSLPTARLVEQARARDARAERALYERHARRIQRFARDLVGNQSDASDVVQETFARAFRLLASLADPDQYVGWLYGIARNVCLEHLKSRRRFRELREQAEHTQARIDLGRDPECDFINRELAERLSTALASLSTNRRTVLLLRSDHGLTYREIGCVMGWSVAKSKVEVHRARLELRSVLGRDRRSR